MKKVFMTMICASILSVPVCINAAELNNDVTLEDIYHNLNGYIIEFSITRQT